MRTNMVSFFIFSKSFQTKKIKALRPKMTKIASRGGGGVSALSHLNTINGGFSLKGGSFFFFRLMLVQGRGNYSGGVNHGITTLQKKILNC